MFSIADTTKEVLIKDLLDDYMSRFKKAPPPQTLFPPNWDALILNRCPLCHCRLYFPRSGKIANCKSKKHKGYVITLKRLEEVKQKWSKQEKKEEPKMN